MIIEVHALDDAYMKMEMFCPSTVEAIISDFGITKGKIYEVKKLISSTSGKISVVIKDNTGQDITYPIHNFKQKR